MSPARSGEPGGDRQPGEALQPRDLQRWLRSARAELEAQRSTLNRLNVYPRPDRDTGTNMTSTMTAAVDASDGRPGDQPTMADLCAAVSAAVWGNAPGNSGQILARILLAMFGEFSSGAAVGPLELETALSAGAAAAAQMLNPAHGTMVTVMAEVARAVRSRGTEWPLDELARAARAACHEALARTPSQLPALAKFNVLDAGALGLCIVLDALFDQVS